MAGVRIVTDSACDLTAEEAERFGIEIVPLSIRFGSDEFEDRTELTVQGFYELMEQRPELPETAAPSPGKFEAAFRRQAEAGADAVVCINLSSQLSATMAAAENAARAIADELPVRVVDSRSITAGLGTQVLQAAERAAEGASADDVVAVVEDLRARTHVLGCLDTLENLKKGGRIGGAQAMLGSLLSIKPMIDISTGVVEEAGKHRTRKKSLEALRDKLPSPDQVEHLAIMHGMAPDVDVMTRLLDDAGYEYRLGHIGAVIGSHGGPRVVGACWVDQR
ncbi:MAG TPA: DegV family protein [Acidimicrobiales bacterium]|nr:DegV family protein [Acidimicrobiales bacterium]